MRRRLEAVLNSPAPLRAAVTVFALICLALVLAPWIAPYDPTEQVLASRLQAASAAHWLGTDHVGRDVLSRLLYGGRFSVTIAALVLLVSAATGTFLGAMSARIGGLFDEFLMRVADILLSFPEILVALILTAILKPSFVTLITALVAVAWTPFARLTRAITLEINTMGYIEAAEALGCSRSFIVLRHIIPNAMGPVLAMAFLRFADKLVAVGSLSYLGLGVQPPDSDWGSMIADAQPYMERAPLLIIAPALAIFICALAVTIAGQNLGQRRMQAVQDVAEVDALEPSGVESLSSARA
jgi:ABC-type dipeptide/oligopeptide/nickel transport system permease subunit